VNLYTGIYNAQKPNRNYTINTVGAFEQITVKVYYGMHLG